MKRIPENNRLLLLIISLVFLLITGNYYKNSAFAFQFVDEQYNLAIGKYLLRNEVLYDDIITNHQPITHLLSFAVQKYSNPNNTFMLLIRHREFIILWSTIWSLLFALYFGLPALFFIFLYELTKGLLLGNLFLAESLVVYPLIFLIGATVFNKQGLNSSELLFSGICLGLSLLLLGPIWPTIACLILLLLYQRKCSFIKTLIYITSGMIIIILPILRYVSVSGYFHYYLFTNFTFTIPNYHGSESWITTTFKAFLTPVISFLRTDESLTLWIVKISSLLITVNLIYQKKFKQFLLIIFLLGMSNIRFVSPGNEDYSGFHLLPWYSSLIFITSIIVVKAFKENSHFFIKITNIALVTLVVILTFKYTLPVIFEKQDIQKDYLINYSTHTDRGELIRLIAQPSDTLFVSRDSWLVYWQSNINHLPKLFGYYTWMAGIPKLHSEILDTFIKHPPVFLYCENCKESEFRQFLSQYSQLRKSGNNIDLYVLQKRLKILTQFQLDQLKFYGVSFN